MKMHEGFIREPSTTRQTYGSKMYRLLSRIKDMRTGVIICKHTLATISIYDTNKVGKSHNTQEVKHKDALPKLHLREW